MADGEYKRQRPFRVNVRLSAAELERLQKDSRDVSLSIAELLRKTYMSRVTTLPLLTVPQFNKVMSELNRIGNNINQLARKANIGELVLDKHFLSMEDEFRMLGLFIRRVSGLYQNNPK